MRDGLLSCVGCVIDTIKDVSTVLHKTPMEDLKAIFGAQIENRLIQDKSMFPLLYSNWREKLGYKFLPSLDPIASEGRELGDVFGVIYHLLRCDIPSKDDKRKSFVPGRRLAILASGKLALVPASAHSGDKICFVQSSVVPFVVKEEESGRYESLDRELKGEFVRKEILEGIRHFRVAGACYVDGMMATARLEWDCLPDVDYRKRTILVFH
jgi:hypothetical protein